MRDDFLQPTVETLARRAGYHCSRCRRGTVGPRDGGATSVNIGVASHITAASPGGARYNASLTAEERRSPANGIWLCQNCAKLVDNDTGRFPIATLYKLKERAEALARAELDSDLTRSEPHPALHLPSSPPPGFSLAYIAQSTTFCGRSDELAQLDAFLEDERPFLWWVIAAPAGSGKSRLALELCLDVAADWDSGFLSRANTFNGWESWEPSTPTLIVVDYVAGRAGAVSDIALQLARSLLLRHDNRVRLLLLDRDVSGSWWSDFLRDTSFSEGPDIARSQYALPLRLGALPDDALWSVTTEVAALVGAPVQDSDREARLIEARRIDPNRRPLFAMLAAAVPRTNDHGVSRETLLRVILNRENARWRVTIADDHARERMLNLVTYVTIRGGLAMTLSPPSILWPTSISPLLPDAHFMDEQRYREIVGAAADETRLPAFQPDVLGEFFVLERLKGSTGTQIAAHAALDVVWDEDPQAASQFVRRATADFWSDPAAHFLQDPVVRTDQQREVWAQMIADLVRVAPKSGDPQLHNNLAALRDLAEAHPAETRLSAHRARAEFNLGTLLLLEQAYSKADSQLTAAIDLPLVSPDTKADALNNRGIARWMYQSRDAAFADFSAVLSIHGASNEVRACAFNNRADILFDLGDLEGAIADRSSVLELSDTTYNRRYIARIRRSRAYLQLGRESNALEDLEAILATDDIVVEQKMTARLKRASIREQSRPLDARRDFDAVIASPVNFPGIVAEALVLRGYTLLRADDFGPAIEDLNAALNRADIKPEDLVGANFGLGLAFAEIGEHELAREALTAVTDHADASAQARSQAQALLASIST